MKLVIFGLTISSAWGNGHATLWRGLCRALLRRGHRIVFFERDVPYYASHRDLMPGEMPGLELVLYPDWNAVLPAAKRHLRGADAGIVTSYCPDGVAASELVASAPGLKVFYDLDTPVTLDALRAGNAVAYIGARGLADFDLVLSFTGGQALTALRNELGARRVAPLYGHVDPELHRATAPVETYRADLSYLGTYAADRQATLDLLFLEPARRSTRARFVIGGSLYPEGFPWLPNIRYLAHVSPAEHPAFFSSSRLTLNVTRRAMAVAGYCPSGRLFEAAACGVPIITDWWEGLDRFFTPQQEVLVCHSCQDVLEAMSASDAELGRMARAARERTLAQHTSEHRADELERELHAAGAREPGRGAA